MTDLIDRLHASVRDWALSSGDMRNLAEEAAAEIERLILIEKAANDNALAAALDRAEGGK